MNSAKTEVLKNCQYKSGDPFSDNIRTINTLRNKLDIMKTNKQSAQYSFSQKKNNIDDRLES